MREKRKISGFQKKYLVYTLTLLFVALLFTSVGITGYMYKNQTSIITDKYAFYNEKAGISLDSLYHKTEEVTADCIVNNMVQGSLSSAGLSDVEKNSLSKYFAYMNLDDISEYCYVDNKKNVYTRSYTKLSYNTFSTSGFIDKLGDSYAKTIWFVSEDKLFGTNEKSLYIGRKVHSQNYAQKVGYLFIKMNPEFLKGLMDVDNSYSSDVATGIIDPDGYIVATSYPDSFELSKKAEDELRLAAAVEEAGPIVKNKSISGGKLFVYRQKESGFSFFTIIPDSTFYKGLNNLYKVLAIIYLVAIICAVLLSIYMSNMITRPIRVLNQAMEEFNGDDFGHIIELNTNTELDNIGKAYNELLDKIKSLLEEVKAQQKELRHGELNMLISQINPHFIYNTLDTIYMLARINKEETTMKMIQALSKYLRLSLSKGSEIVTLEDELENVKSYMQIQQIRNENLFTYSVGCDVDPKKTYILKLILQPIVENAIKYGFCDIYEGGKIDIKIWEESKMLVLSVYNSGKSIDEDKATLINSLKNKPILEGKTAILPNEKNGYGIYNVLTRLRLMYGEDIEFMFKPEEDGTSCIIKIPKESVRNEEG
ncbi:MAG: sensor histidine kinase [Lachnospiraceae bacterium]|nr:sensor histidine kinase [Lachnospiraceae bacterium]